MRTQTSKGHGLGWRRDARDERDKDACHLLGLAATRPPVPQSVDLRTSGFMPDVYDQLKLGSCTGNSVAANLEFAANKNGKGTGTPSRLFIYYHERLIEGDVEEDNGAEIRDGLKVVSKIGAPPETLWPYDVAKFADAPSPQAETAAGDQKATSYYRVKDMAGTLDALAAGYCVSFGFTVYESFESAEVEKTGVVPMPEQGEQVEGGHAVVAVGYDLAKKLMLVRNSWGPGWGEHGYFWLPFGFWEQDLTSDFWCCEVAS